MRSFVLSYKGNIFFVREMCIDRKFRQTYSSILNNYARSFGENLNLFSKCNGGGDTGGGGDGGGGGGGYLFHRTHITLTYILYMGHIGSTCLPFQVFTNY